jgi:hypothetical protein
MRYYLIYKPLRAILSRSPFPVIMFYSKLMALLRLVPVLGVFLEKSNFCVMGDVQRPAHENAWNYMKRRFRNTSLNTFDNFGSHSFQHLKSEYEIRSLIKAMQPNMNKVINIDKYFQRPTPVGCALRIFR